MKENILVFKTSSVVFGYSLCLNQVMSRTAYVNSQVVTNSCPGQLGTWKEQDWKIGDRRSV